MINKALIRRLMAVYKEAWEKRDTEKIITKFKLKRIYMEGDTAIVEWEARFYNTKKRHKTHLKGIAVLEIEHGKIKSLREYWHSTHTK